MFGLRNWAKSSSLPKARQAGAEVPGQQAGVGGLAFGAGIVAEKQLRSGGGLGLSLRPAGVAGGYGLGFTRG